MKRTGTVLLKRCGHLCAWWYHYYWLAKRLAVRRLLWTGLLMVVVGGLILVGVGNDMIEHRFIYYPERVLVGSPADLGLAFEEALFPSSDGVELHGWFVPGKGDITWLWFHGNGGNISHRLENLKLLHDKLGVNVFLFDYQGYGRSQGKPSEQGTYRDGEAALAYLRSRQDVDERRIVYYGRSLGVAVAVEMAVRHRPYGLILESGFTSVREMARRIYPFLPVWPFLRTKYDSLSKIGRVGVPLLFLHGDRDEIVPLDVGKKLFKAAPEPKEFFLIPGAGHNDTYLVGGDAYWEAFGRYMEGLERKSEG